MRVVAFFCDRITQGVSFGGFVVVGLVIGGLVVGGLGGIMMVLQQTSNRLWQHGKLVLCVHCVKSQKQSSEGIHNWTILNY